jgi:hypothetical protein
VGHSGAEDAPPHLEDGAVEAYHPRLPYNFANTKAGAPTGFFAAL